MGDVCRKLLIVELMGKHSKMCIRDRAGCLQQFILSELPHMP